MLAAMLALWAFRARVGYVEFNGLLLMWLFFPLAAFGMGYRRRKLPMANAYFVLSVIYCLVYALYCWPRDPDNNLPLLFVPLMLAVFSSLFLLVMAVHEWARRRPPG